MRSFCPFLLMALCACAMPGLGEGQRRKRADDVPSINGVVEGLSQQLTQLTAQFSAMQNEITSLKQKFDATQTAVAFRAYHTERELSVASHGTIVFNAVSLNTGNGYDTQTGVFTAPVSGTYVFFTNCMALDNTQEHSYITVEGRGIGGCYSSKPTGSPYEQGAALSTVHLRAGQRVWVHIGEDAENVFGDWNSFTGFLIQADA